MRIGIYSPGNDSHLKQRVCIGLRLQPPEQTSGSVDTSHEYAFSEEPSGSNSSHATTLAVSQRGVG